MLPPSLHSLRQRNIDAKEDSTGPSDAASNRREAYIKFSKQAILRRLLRHHHMHHDDAGKHRTSSSVLNNTVIRGLPDAKVLQHAMQVQLPLKLYYFIALGILPLSHSANKTDTLGAVGHGRTLPCNEYIEAVVDKIEVIPAKYFNQWAQDVHQTLSVSKLLKFLTCNNII